ncbi:hypothetical protein Aau02nite_85670 [Amorphoplanes auranticolor]|uniref:Uncharacterized protein n=1 Tax=Actinoplanes auranticolor TaxID=47988 RepID=A0A919SXW7_9ACTN|nr:hypothetical protein Aau02nite_85670 [Actinoplanes auranticolor]
MVIELADADTGTVCRSGRVDRADFRLPLKRLLRRSPGVTILKLVGERLAPAVPPAGPSCW